MTTTNCSNTTLVSITVVSYNSSKTITETLESIAKQTYSKIELIISDDASQDNTVDIAKQWLSENKTRFVNSTILTSVKNKGLTPNVNRGWRASKGEWVKLIAADDILIPKAISTFLEYTQTNPKCNILFSKIELFGESTALKSHNTLFWEESYRLIRSLNSADEQFKQLKKGNFFPAAATFIRRSTLEKLDGYDEDIPFLEDYPMWIKATHNGFRLWFIDEPLVKYRTSLNSMQINNPKLDLSNAIFRYKYLNENRISKYLIKFINNYKPKIFRNKIILYALKITSKLNN